MKNVCLILAAVIICVSGWVKADITSNLVAHWEFDDGSGNTAYNSVSNKHGTLVGDPVWTTGIIGGALEFDGAGDYVVVDSYKGITGTQSRTFAAWIRADSTDIYEPEAIVSWGRYNTSGGYWNLQLERDNFRGTPGALHLEVEDGWKVGDTDLADDSWHHVAVVLENDGSPNASEIKLYVDGVEEFYSASNSQAINTSFFENVRIGCGAWNYNPSAFFNGAIDDVRIYDRALSDTDIVELSEVPEPCTVTILILGLPLLRKRRV